MLKYLHVINHVGSDTEVRYFYEPFAIIDAHWQGKRAGGADHWNPNDMAYRGIVFEEIFKNGKKARAKAQEKKFLRCSRSSAIILFLAKGAVL